MKKIDQIKEICEDNECECVTLDGYDNAIIGASHDVNGNIHVVYDYSKMIDSLVVQYKNDKNNAKMPLEELVRMAVDYYCYNTERTLPYIEEDKRPIVVSLVHDED